MKMEHEIKAFADCVIENIPVAIDEQVLPKQLLVVVATSGS
jgi:biotin carboxyl carrier protein